MKIRILFLLCVWLLLFHRPGASADYHTHAQLGRQLAQWAGQYPQTLSVQQVAKSAQGREIWCVSVFQGRAEDHPALLIIAGTDGNDLVSSEIALGFIQQLVEGRRDADSLSALLQHTTFYIFPRVNPDAGEAFFIKPLEERHANSRPVDDDLDGRKDEDGCEDLNNDGFITMMRIKDVEGGFRPDEKDPQLLRWADRSKGEIGLFRLLTEGVDNDKDGQWNEDGPGGVDLNINFPFAYKNFAKDAGDYPFSEPESRSLADFCFSHPNIAAVFSFSGQDNVFHSWKTGTDLPDRNREEDLKPLTTVLPKDALIYTYLTDQFKAITRISDAPDNCSTGGDVGQWAYFHFGRWSLSTAPWWPPFIKAKTDTGVAKEKTDRSKTAGKDSLATQRRLLHWLQAFAPDGFVPWQPYSHVDFPGHVVEIGGFNPFVSVNPPADSLSVLTRRFSPFLLRLAALLPQLAIEQLQVTALHNQVYRMDGILVNRGFLPTNSYLGVRVDACRKVKVELDADTAVTISSGPKIQIIDVIAGSHGTVRLSWILTGRKGCRVVLKAGSPMTGMVEQTIVLP